MNLFNQCGVLSASQPEKCKLSLAPSISLLSGMEIALNFSSPNIDPILGETSTTCLQETFEALKQLLK
jgi:hypothetical protein